jgi:hypothetical protein
MEELILEYISFRPIKKIGSLIGFISFKIGKDYSWYQIGVHKLKNPKGHVKIRLLYPERQHPETKVMQEEIDEGVNSYILAQYPESLKG